MKFSLFKKKKEHKEEKRENWLTDERIGEPVVDAYETDNEIIIYSPIGGITPKDLEVSVVDDMLVIRGQRKEIETHKDKKYFCQECFWGEFVKKIILPKEVDVEKIKASVKNGVLILNVPKKKLDEKKEVKISVKEDY